MNNCIGDILLKKSQLYGDRIALMFENEKSVTYRDLDKITNCMANGLAKIGVRKGDRVAIFMPNSLEIIYSWLAINKLGAIEVPINLANRGDFLLHILNNSESTVLIVDEELIERVQFIEKNLTWLKYVITWSKKGTSLSPLLKFENHTFENLLDQSSEYPPRELRKRDPLAIIYTSGTTGVSKGVLYSGGEALMAAKEYLEAIRCAQDDIFFTSLPLFHGNAQCLCVLPGLISGSKTVIYERFSASNFWRQIRNSKATVFNSLGAMAPFIYNQPESPEEKDNTVRVCMAAPMPANIFKNFEERYQLKVIEGYGLTETGMITYNPWDSPINGSCGKATSNYEVRILDEDDNELPPNNVGEIVARAKEPWTMCLGYYKMPEKTIEAFRNFYFHTGDAGFIDDEGYLYFKDRAKDYIRRRGENISSFEVEHVFLGHPNISECAAIAVKSEHSEDEVMIVIVTKDGAEVPYEELLDWCTPRMPYFAVPRYILFQDKLPKTPNEKVQKEILRRQGITAETWDREEVGYKVSR